MARYEMSQAKTMGALTAGPICQLRAGSTRSLRVYEVGISLSAPNAITLGLIRPTAIGSGFTSSPVGASEDANATASTAVIDTAMTTAPTIGTNYMRQFALPAQQGAGLIWTFPTGITVPASTALALWQIAGYTTAAQLSIYFIWDE